MITESYTQRLGLQRSSCEIDIKGIVSSKKLNTSTVKLQIAPTAGHKLNVRASVLPKLAEHLASVEVSTKRCLHARSITLEDRNYSFSHQIDMILGYDVYEDVVLDGEMEKGKDLKLRNFVFEWVVSEQATSYTKLDPSKTQIFLGRETIAV